MTDSELIKLKPSELAAALGDKETIAKLRAEPGILAHVIEALPEKELADAFVKNKFAPKEAVIQYPAAFIEAFIEYGFNPGTDGILDLCQAPGGDAGRDAALARLMRAFPTNKYDAAFTRSLMNLVAGAGGYGTPLSETLAFLMQGSGVALILLKDLRGESARSFLGVLERLTGDIAAEAAGLIDSSVIGQVSGDNQFLLKVLKLACRFQRRSLLGDYQAYAFLNVLSDPGLGPQVSDEEAAYYLGASEQRRHYSSKKIPYRKAFEALEGEGFSSLLSGIPRESKFFLKAFSSGNAFLGAAEAYELLSLYQTNATYQTRRGGRRRGGTSGLLGAVLRSGTSAEMAALITAKNSTLISHMKECSITPAHLRDAIGMGRPEVAKAVMAIVGADFRKSIVEYYSDLKPKAASPGGPGVADRHEAVCKALRNGESDGFTEAILAYEPGGSVEANIDAFLARHGQATYKKKYERMTVTLDALARLKDEAIAMRLARSRLRIGFSYYWAGGGQPFLSAKNAQELLAARQYELTPTTLLRFTYEKDKFLALLSRDELAALRIAEDGASDEEKEPSLEIAELLIEKARSLPPDFPISVSSEALLYKVASMLAKAECRKWFACEPMGRWEFRHDLIFKGCERYAVEDFIAAAKAMHGDTGPFRLIEALEKLKATTELRSVCEAIVATKTDAFQEMFPHAGNRGPELRNKATKILASMGAGLVNVGEVLRKNKHVSSLIGALGDDWLALVLAHKTSRKPKIAIDKHQEIDAADLERLAAKYTLVVPLLKVRDSEELALLKNYISANIKIERVDFSGLYLDLSSQRAILQQAVASCQGREIDMDFGRGLLAAATVDGCLEILRGLEPSAVLERINSVGQLSYAQQLQIPISSSIEVATRVASDIAMLKFAIQEKIEFDDLVVVVAPYRIQNISPEDRQRAKAIGLNIMTEDERRTWMAYERVFDEAGEIRDFEPLPLNGLSMSDRVELVRRLISKNPKYKKLLSQSLGSGEFVLNPPKLLDKSLLTMANLRDLLGFGMPGDLSKEEKDSLSDLLVASGSLIALASQNIKGFLSLGGLNEVRFEDVFARQKGKALGLSEFGAFMGARYQSLGEDARQVFRSVLKDPSKSELFSLIKDRNGEYTMDFLKDSIRSLGDARRLANHFIAILGEDSLSATVIFDAMAGDNAANALLDERMTEGDDAAAMLKDLSAAVKRVTVEISIARKQAKAGEAVSLARALHDALGGLVAAITRALDGGAADKRNKMKTGFERFNEALKEEGSQVRSRANKAYSIYFPASLGEVKQVGTEKRWCTSYNDSYFDDTIGGTAVLFNLKEGEEIVAQGYLRKGEKNQWVMNQLRYPGNANAMDDFDTSHMIGRINELIKGDEKLSERYLIA